MKTPWITILFAVLICIILILGYFLYASLTSINEYQLDTVVIGIAEHGIASFAQAIEISANKKIDTQASFFSSDLIDYTSLTGINLGNGLDLFSADNLKKMKSLDFTIKVQFYADENLCNKKCGFPFDGCFLLTFIAPEIPNGFKQDCLNIPIYTTFVSKNSTDCLFKNGYTQVDPIEKIPAGKYIISNISSENGTYPKLCIYRKN